MNPLAHKLTASGAICAASGLLLVIWAWVSGNALATIAGFSLLVGCAVHFFVSFLSIRKLETRIESLGDRARAREAIPIALVLRNTGRLFPTPPISCLLVETGRGKPMVVRVDRFIAPGDSFRMIIYPRFFRRGNQQLILESQSTKFPFALSSITRTPLLASNPLRIWPESDPNAGDAIRRLDALHRADRPDPYSRGSERSDPNRFRNYHRGDSKSHINWRLSAKANQLIVSESPDYRLPSLYFVLDSNANNWPRASHFEEAIRILSSLLEESRARRWLSGIILDGKREHVRSQSDLEALFDRLSILERSANSTDTKTAIFAGHIRITCVEHAVSVIDWNGRKLL